MAEWNKETYLKQLSKEIHKPVHKRYLRAKVITTGIDEIWAMDLVDMSSLKKENDEIKFILTVIDCFSRYAWAVAIKDKTGQSVLHALQSIISSSKRQPTKIWTDEGKEFLNKPTLQWLKKHKITIYHTYGEHKASIVERFNRTLKTMMWRKFTEENTYKWITMLPDLLKSYNSKKHSSLGMTPIEASKPENEMELWQKLYGSYFNEVALTAESGALDEVENEPPLKLRFGRSALKVGDWVRISRVKRQFEKGYTHGWSIELFKVIEVIPSYPLRYRLQDRKDHVIKGTFYGDELQKTKLSDVFLIEKVLEERYNKRKKTKEYYVKFLGYGNEFNMWMPEKDLLQI